MQFNSFKDAMQHMSKSIKESDITTEDVKKTRKTAVNSISGEAVQHNKIKYKRHSAAKGYVDYGADDSSFLYQIVPDQIEEGLDLSPALQQIFSSIQNVTISNPESEFPAWTVRIENVLLNPWIAGLLTEDYLNKVVKLLD